jgi:hypothetical protein
MTKKYFCKRNCKGFQKDFWWKKKITTVMKPWKERNFEESTYFLKKLKTKKSKELRKKRTRKEEEFFLH